MKIKEIREICNKYGENVFRMALSHMVAVGSDQLRRANMEEAVKVILASDSQNALITPQMQVKILRCAYELARHHELWDILAFVQTDICIHGVTVHPGIIVDFYDGRSNKKCCTYVLPADTDEELIEEVTDAIRKKRSLHNYGGMLDAAVRTEFKEKGIALKPVGQDFGIEL